MPLSCAHVNLPGDLIAVPLWVGGGVGGVGREGVDPPVAPGREQGTVGEGGEGVGVGAPFPVLPEVLSCEGVQGVQAVPDAVMLTHEDLGWLVGWLVGWLFGWLVGRLVGW
jgi:hypothetical protein